MIDSERFSLPSKNGLQSSKEKGWEGQGRAGSCCQFHFLEPSVEGMGRQRRPEHFAAGREREGRGGGDRRGASGITHHCMDPNPAGVPGSPGGPVGWSAGTHAPKLDPRLPGAWGGWGHEGSGPPDFVLPQVQGHSIQDPERCSSGDMSCDNPNQQLPDSAWRPPPWLPSRACEAHALQTLTSDASLLQSGSKYA